MSTFHFSKIITGVSPMLAKETVLSKIINMVDIFKISLGGGFDDNNKKYIDTLMKLDNSKTIMLETRGNDFRIKNTLDIKLKEKQIIEMEYSEYAQENAQRIYADATFLGELKTGQQVHLEQSGITMKVKSTKDDVATLEVIKGGSILQYDKVLFPGYEDNIPFFSEREKKDILRGLEYGIHVIGASLTSNKNDLFELKEFLAAHNAEKMKVFAKIENAEGIKNLEEIMETADGIILVHNKIENDLKKAKMKIEDIIALCKHSGKPIVVTFSLQEITDQEIKKYSQLCLDCFMIDTFLTEEETVNTIIKTTESREKYELGKKSCECMEFYKDNENFTVRDYIIYNAYRTTQELDIKAIVSFTENGYTSARLSSLGPKVPVIAFTKGDETYRYINMLRGTRGYKISQSFTYDNLKRVGKEMIRIIFKGNISLDEKILIVQANEIIKDEKTGMINGLELYKFKNI